MGDGPTEPLLFHEAINLMPKKDLLLQTVKKEGFNTNEPFVMVAKTNIFQLIFLQPFIFLRLLLIQQFPNTSKLLFNGLFCKNANQHHPIQIWIFNSSGGLKKIEYCFPASPKLDRFKKRSFCPQQSLSQLIGLSIFEPDPVDFNSTTTFLSKHNKLGSVNITYCFSYHIKNGAETWNDPLDSIIFIEAFTTHHYQLGFRLAKFKTRKQAANKIIVNDKTFVATEEPSVKQANKSSAVNVKLVGLNLAFNLGIISLKEVQNFSIEIGKCVASVWMEYDNLCNARYVTVSAYNNFYQTEIKNELSWTKIFDFLYKIKIVMSSQKRQVLFPLLTKLSNVSSIVNSPYKTCAQQLMHSVDHLTIVLFSKDDTCIHAIKFQFASYLKEKKKKNYAIQLNRSASNTLTMLRTKEMTFLNLNMYLNQDAVFCSILPQPNISHTIKRLFNQPKMNSTTVPSLCKQRGKEIVPQLSACWSTIGQFFMDHFQLDIFSSHFRSLSYLAFVAVWSKCAKEAGIFYQGLEKTKVAYEKIFRSFSHGGFSFSCKDFLECGQPIFGTHGDKDASTLIGLDIISSYGYAGSQIQIPTGFCNAYFDNGVGFLQLCEPFARHNSFEFMSVYYTLHLLLNQAVDLTRQIKTVFSNFHSNGIFYIKNYPIDLAVVFSNGDISLYQFDGAYAHGCREGCQLYSSFVRGRKRSDLEADTEKRDTVINLWVKETNEKKMMQASYVVITDCHHQDYRVQKLKHHFYSIPILAQLICGYPTAKTCTKDDVLFSNDNLTFIIILEGFVPRKSNSNSNHDNRVLLPLFSKSNDKVWNRTDQTNSSPMLLTKDYLCWLTKHFNFQVTKIHSVFFYKKCKVLNSIYTELTLLRMKDNVSAPIKQLVKNVINFSAGYFGLNEKKRAKTTLRLMSGIGSTYNTKKHTAELVATFNNVNFFIVTTARAMSIKEKMSVAPLPIFVGIVEFGKKRLSEILCFFDKFMLPSYYRHLYSNVDNVLFVLSTATLNEAVDPKLFDEYCKKKVEFFNLVPLPGHLKEEVHVTPDQEWKFVSAALMNFCIITKNSNQTIFKCLFNNLTGEEVFENSLKLLKKEKIEVMQTRRINKLVNKDVKTQIFKFNKNN